MRNKSAFLLLIFLETLVPFTPVGAEVESQFSLEDALADE